MIFPISPLTSACTVGSFRIDPRSVVVSRDPSGSGGRRGGLFETFQFGQFLRAGLPMAGLAAQFRLVVHLRDGVARGEDLEHDRDRHAAYRTAGCPLLAARSQDVLVFPSRGRYSQLQLPVRSLSLARARPSFRKGVSHVRTDAPARTTLERRPRVDRS